ncbi:hypothetical protein [Streptomyces omiyaensis]|uniref:Uncharacterized protein n=1 Tax=Streptomyces omiyaensis TaxID=68247 RepID=A0ABW7BU56_9ACTN
MPQVDTRLVQTAVIGGRDSEQPVILPEEPHNLDEFRRQFGTDRFWCGTLLGGCGEKLMTKRYETKVCHFSHYPAQDGSRASCHRAANGVDSADHLFVKMHVKEWLAEQGHAAQAELRSLGTGPGDAVDFWLRATQQHLRFELHPEDYRSWRRAADSLGVKEGHVEWVFGPDGPITKDMVARQGYALRVRCESAGTDRKVFIGTVTDRQPVAWARLDACRMTTDGIVTPQLEELRASGTVRAGGMRSLPFPGSLALRAAELVFAPDPGREQPADSSLTAQGRYLVPGFIKPAGSRILRACLSLPDEVPAPTEQFVYRLSGGARLMITDPLQEQGTEWAVRADSLVRLSGLEAERTGLWRPSVSLLEHVTASPRGLPDVVAAPQAEVTRGSTVADRIRRELKKVAAERTTVTWDDLARRTGLDLSHVPDPKRRDLLIEVDGPLTPERPLLCVLVFMPSGRHPFYLAEVLRRLGARVPGSEAALRRWSRQERQRNYDTYGPMPARAQPSPDPSVVTAPAPASRPEPDAGWDVPPPYELKSASLLVNRLRLRLKDTAAIRRRVAEDPGTGLEEAAERAAQHLQAWETARRRTRVLKEWLAAAAPIVSDLEQAIVRTATRDAATGPARSTPTPTVLPADPQAVGSVPDSLAAPPGEVSAGPEGDAHREARAEFQALMDLVRVAQADGDVKAVEAGRRLAGPLYARRLSDADRDRYTPFMQEVKAWCRDHTAKAETDPQLQQVRNLLDQLRRDRETLSVEDLRRTLRKIGQLRPRLTGLLSASEEGEIKNWHGRLTYRERSETGRRPLTVSPTPPAPAGTPPAAAPAPQSGRLPLETIDKLAAVAREILQDQARAGGALLTWGDLRHRMGGALPHLHPDDQGELLVCVDRETTEDEPLLSTLVASADASLHWLYKHVRFSLGRERVPDAELEAHWASEVLRLRQIWRHR